MRGLWLLLLFVRGNEVVEEEVKGKIRRRSTRAGEKNDFRPGSGGERPDVYVEKFSFIMRSAKTSIFHAPKLVERMTGDGRKNFKSSNDDYSSTKIAAPAVMFSITHRTTARRRVILIPHHNLRLLSLILFLVFI